MCLYTYPFLIDFPVLGEYKISKYSPEITWISFESASSSSFLPLILLILSASLSPSQFACCCSSKDLLF